MSRLDPALPRISDVLRIRVVGGLVAAEVQSLIGDQLARVALSVFVFDQTGNVAATSATYAATFLPALFGGMVLARIGDRLPRRSVMIGCDIARAAVFAVLALWSVPLWALFVMVVLAVLLEPVFSAAQVAYLAHVLDPEPFRATTGVRMALHQLAQVAGFAAGGLIVGLIGPASALMINAVTFVVSSGLIAVVMNGARERASMQAGKAVCSGAGGSDDDRSSPWRAPRMQQLLALTMLAGLFVVPEGLAVPLSAELGASSAVAGLLLAAIPLGGAIGAMWMIRGVPAQRRESVSGLMAIACGLPLVVTFLLPVWPVVLVAWMLSGAASAYQVEVISELAHSAPDERRSRVIGVASGCLVSAQGVGLVVFGALAVAVGSASSIAIAGVTGSVLALGVVFGRSATGAAVSAAAVPAAGIAAAGIAAAIPPAQGYAVSIEADRPSAESAQRPVRVRPRPGSRGVDPRSPHRSADRPLPVRPQRTG